MFQFSIKVSTAFESLSFQAKNMETKTSWVIEITRLLWRQAVRNRGILKTNNVTSIWFASIKIFHNASHSNDHRHLIVKVGKVIETTCIKLVDKKS